MRCMFWCALLVFSSSVWAFGQNSHSTAPTPGAAGTANCTAYTVVTVQDRSTQEELENLQPADFQIRAGGADLTVASAKRDFHNRVLVLVQTEPKPSDRMAEITDLAARLTREAPEGRPLAFGVFAKRSAFTKDFSTETKARAAAIGAVREETASLGNGAALYD